MDFRGRSILFFWALRGCTGAGSTRGIDKIHTLSMDRLEYIGVSEHHFPAHPFFLKK